MEMNERQIIIFRPHKTIVPNIEDTCLGCKFLMLLGEKLNIFCSYNIYFHAQYIIFY